MSEKNSEHTLPHTDLATIRAENRRLKQEKNVKYMKFISLCFLCLISYITIRSYASVSKPYTIAIDPGHGGTDVGAIGFINEVDMIEGTVAELVRLLEEDGRFYVVLSRKYGETKSIIDRNKYIRTINPDLLLSIHGNSNTNPQSYGFECFVPAPTSANNQESIEFASYITNEFVSIGARMRGENGIKYGYYVPVSDSTEVYEKLFVPASDTSFYPYSTFGILTNMSFPSVLVEQCFITNETDVLTFGTEDGQKRSALAYYKAIVRYLEDTKPISSK